MTDLWWVGDQMLYYDYTPDTVEFEPGENSRIVAEACIYDDEKRLRVQMKVRVTGSELRGMTLAEAIQRGRAIRERMAIKHLATLSPRWLGDGQRQRMVVYDLRGHEIERGER